jgi:hypothetical protein
MTLVVDFEGKGPMERPRRRLVDNIKINVGAIIWGLLNWIDLTEVSDY